jgi:hypothetical protein
MFTTSAGQVGNDRFQDDLTGSPDRMSGGAISGSNSRICDCEADRVK